MRVCGHEEWQPLKIMINEDGTRSAAVSYTHLTLPTKA